MYIGVEDFLIPYCSIGAEIYITVSEMVGEICNS